jgi:UDP-3-O-[3-hydroxymyristoyl] glucosamine N-acyltransferase
MTLQQLAEALGAELTGGHGEAPVLGISGLDNAAPGYVAYVENDRGLAQAEAGPALALIAPLTMPQRTKPLLRVANPRLAYARALRLSAPPRLLPAGVHPTAVIGPGTAFGEAAGARAEQSPAAAGVAIGAYCVIEGQCRIGEGTRIHPFAAIGQGVHIGPNCEIYPHVTIHDHTVIGADVVIHPGAVIGSAGFGYAQDGERHVHIPHIGNVVVEDQVEIGANVTIDRATTGSTVIGQGTKIDNLVHIAHNVRIGRHCLLAGQVGISGSVTIGDHVVLAGQAGVTDHVLVGERVRAAARSAIIGDVPPGAVVWGCPARPRGEQLRIDAATSRLPELVRTVRDLVRRLSELEAKLR